jgi:hypothetical protein
MLRAVDIGQIEIISYQHTKFHVPNYRVVPVLSFYTLHTKITVYILQRLLPKFWVRTMNSDSVVPTLEIRMATMSVLFIAENLESTDAYDHQ